MEINIDKLPNVIVVYILSYLNTKDVLSFSCINKKYNKISKNNMLWKGIFERQFYVPPDLILDTEINLTKSLDKVKLKGSQNLLELGKSMLNDKENDGRAYDQFIKKIKMDKIYDNAKPVFSQLPLEQSVVVVRVTKKLLIFGYALGPVAAFDLEESSMGLKEAWRNTDNESFIWWMEVSEDILGIACNNGKINLIDINNGKLIGSFECFKRPCWVIKVNKAADRFLGGSDGGEIVIYKLSTQTLISKIKYRSSIYDLCILDSHNFLMGSNSGVLKAYTLPSTMKEGDSVPPENIEEKSLVAHEDEDTIWVLSVNEYNNIFTSSSDMAICFWDLKTKNLIRKFPMEKTVQSVCIYENKIFAGLGGFQPLLCVWSFERTTQKESDSMQQHLDDLDTSFSSDIILTKLSEIVFKESASRIYSLVVRGNKVVFASDRKVFYVDFEHQKIDKKKCLIM